MSSTLIDYNQNKFLALEDINRNFNTHKKCFG